MSDTPITITDQVLAHLRSQILSGSIQPGSRIDQGEIARQFGVSLVPVREALARLQSSGLVHIIPHRGVFVETISLDELIDIYYMREVLEEQAAQVAVKYIRRRFAAIDPEYIRLIDFDIAKNDVNAHLQHTRDFHFVIYEASRRRNLVRIIRQLWDQSDRYRRMQMDFYPARMQESQFENNAMLAACHKRDGTSLALMVRYRIHQTTAGIRQLLKGNPAVAQLEPDTD